MEHSGWDCPLTSLLFIFVWRSPVCQGMNGKYPFGFYLGWVLQVWKYARGQQQAAVDLAVGEPGY